MTGYCPDCGNQDCACAEIRATAADVIKSLLRTGDYRPDGRYRPRGSRKTKALKRALRRATLPISEALVDAVWAPTPEWWAPRGTK